MSAGRHRRGRLPRPDRAAPAGAPADGADRRRPALARRLGIPVVYDFRAADVAAGGQGAPLVPVYHRALARDARRSQPPVAVLNIGGVANVTFIDGDDPIACDTGPGNALIDDFVRAAHRRAARRRRQIAPRAARSTRTAIARVARASVLRQPPPKSLDRNEFRLAGWVGLADSSVEDGAATLTALTAAAVARIVPHLPRRAEEAGSSPAAARAIRP